MKLNEPKISFILVYGVMIALVVFLSQGEPKLGADEPKLKASKEDILGNKKIKDGVIKYAYNSKVKANGASDEVLGSSNGDNLEQVNITNHAKVYKKNKKNDKGEDLYVAEIIAGDPQYFQGTDNEWYIVDYATTTEDIFNTALKPKLKERFVNFFKGKVLAASGDPIYPDPDAETSSVDGFAGITGQDSTWSTIIGANGTTHDDSGTNLQVFLMRGSGTTDQWAEMSRTIFVYDTSVIGAGATVTSGTLYIYGNNNAGDPQSNTPSVNVYDATTSANDDLVNSDFENVGSTAQATALTYAQLTAANNAYAVWTLNAAGLTSINTTGASKFSMRNPEYDVADSAPSWGSGAYTYWYGKSADTAGTATDPKIIIDYSVSTAEVKKYPSIILFE